MVSRKRAHSEVEAESEQQPKEPGLLARLRNCWEFANLMQYIYIFGKVVKIDEEFGIEVCHQFILSFAETRVLSEGPPFYYNAMRFLSPTCLVESWI